MRRLSSLGIGLSLASGCLFLALVAEIYYLFWWKKRRTNRGIEDNYFDLFYLLCWKRPSSLTSTALNPREICTSGNPAGLSDDRLHLNSNKDNLLNQFEAGNNYMDAELMRLHSLSGPPRFLFTIKEETKEDLESEDGRSRGGTSRKGSRGKSLSDLMDTPFFTPLSSPPFYTPPLTPFYGYNQNGFNPLFESSREDSFNRLWSSPPPKFKFLKDAEEKLYKKTLMEETIKGHRNRGFDIEDQLKKVAGAGYGPHSSSEEDERFFITLVLGKNRDRTHQQHSCPSQVTPLHSSPSNFRI